jgi:hypothetical protein
MKGPAAFGLLLPEPAIRSAGAAAANGALAQKRAFGRFEHRYRKSSFGIPARWNVRFCEGFPTPAAGVRGTVRARPAFENLHNSRSPDWKARCCVAGS